MSENNTWQIAQDGLRATVIVRTGFTPAGTGTGRLERNTFLVNILGLGSLELHISGDANIMNGNLGFFPSDLKKSKFS